MKKDQRISNVIIYQASNGALELKGDFDKETVWASQNQIADIFGVERSVITKHIKNIFADEELDEKSNVQNLHIANSDKPVKFYNLDIILAVGYRTKSSVAIQFRKWATETLKNHLTKGYTINKKLLAKNYNLFQQALTDIQKISQNKLSSSDVLELVKVFGHTWFSLDAFDKEQFCTKKQTQKSIKIEAQKLFLLPPLPEQQAIASVLSAFDDKIELLREQNKTLEEIGQTIFERWFVDFECENKGKNGDGGETPRNEIGETPRRGVSTGAGNGTQKSLPEGWSVGRLSEIAEFLNGIALQKYPVEDENNYLPVIKIRELKAGITAQTDKASKSIDSKYIIDDGDVLFSWSGSLEVVIWQYGKGALNQHLFKVSSEKYPKWFYYFWTLYHLPEFREIASHKATTMGHIQRHHLDQAQVFIPDEKILKELDSQISPILEKIMLINQEIQSLARTRDELLPRLMRGEVRVNDFSNN